MLYEFFQSNESLTALVAVIIAFLIVIVTGLTVHEFSHALAAYELGDATAEQAGRLSLDPRRHLDPLGTLLIALVGFGWAKPTPVNPYRLRHGRLGWALVAVAGPLSNFVVAVLFALPIRFGWVPLLDNLSLIQSPVLGLAGYSEQARMLGYVASWTIYINVILGVFNLIPLPPLDGYRFGVAFLPQHIARDVSRYEAYGPGILMLLFVLPLVTGGSVNPLGDLIRGPVSGLLGVILGI